MTAKRRRVHDKLAALPGVRAVRRPVSPGEEHLPVAGDRDEFDLYYVRTGRRSAHPLVILPGGPGVASVRLYKALRRRAAAGGLDVIMIEHRAVGMSRHDDSGANLPPQALTVKQVVDDVAAVLDDAHVDTAVIYGTSYGAYIAAGVGVCHPNRVHAMILDSPLLSRDDIAAVRDAIHGLLWDGDGREAAVLAPKVRQLVASGVMTPAAAQLAATLYCYGGASLLDRQLDLLLAGRMVLWHGLRLVIKLLMRKAPTAMRATWLGASHFVNWTTPANPTGYRSTRRWQCANSPEDSPFRSRTLRLCGGDAEVLLAGGGDFRWSRSLHAASGSRAHRIAHSRCGAAADADHGAQHAGQSRERCAPNRHVGVPRGTRRVGGPGVDVGRCTGAAGGAFASELDPRSGCAESALPTALPSLPRRLRSANATPA